LKTANLVPWEVQAVNTCPDNFLWEQGSGTIITVSPGLYEIVFGFYSKIKPKVSVQVNGEIVMCLNQEFSKLERA